MCEFHCCNMDLVSEFFKSVGEFAGNLVHPCKKTSVGEVLSFRGNPVAALQSVIVISFWVQMLIQVTDAITVFAHASSVHSIDGHQTLCVPCGCSPGMAELNGVKCTCSIMSTGALAGASIVNVLFSIGIYFFVYSLQWFAIVKKLGCCWFWCVCFEGHNVLTLLGILNLAAASLNVWAALVVMALVGMTKTLSYMLCPPWGYVKGAELVLLGICNVVTAIYMIKVGCDPERERDLEDVSGSESEE